MQVIIALDHGDLGWQVAGETESQISPVGWKNFEFGREEIWRFLFQNSVLGIFPDFPDFQKIFPEIFPDFFGFSEGGLISEFKFRRQAWGMGPHLGYVVGYRGVISHL